MSVAKGTRPLLEQAGLKTAIDERYSSNASEFDSLYGRIAFANNGQIQDRPAT